MQTIDDLYKACDLAEKSAVSLLQKSHVKEYTRSDGTVVQEHDDSRTKHDYLNTKMVHHSATGSGDHWDKWSQHDTTGKELRARFSGNKAGEMKVGDLIHHADRKTKGTQPALARHKNGYISGPEKAVWAAHKLIEHKTQGTFAVNSGDHAKIAEHVKKKTGEDIKFHKRNHGDSLTQDEHLHGILKEIHGQ